MLKSMILLWIEADSHVRLQFKKRTHNVNSRYMYIIQLPIKIPMSLFHITKIKQYENHP